MIRIILEFDASEQDMDKIIEFIESRGISLLQFRTYKQLDKSIVQDWIDLTKTVNAMADRSNDRNKQEEKDKEQIQLWTLYWKDGKKEIIQGSTLEEAFTKYGFGAGAKSALDFYVKGTDASYNWNNKDKSWDKITNK